MTETRLLTGTAATYAPPGPVPGAITPQQCAAYGGHCPEPTGMGYQVRCKHCGLTGTGTPQPSVRYEWPALA
jgi:hypothetical protein